MNDIEKAIRDEEFEKLLLKCKQFGHFDSMDGGCVYCYHDDKELFKKCIKHRNILRRLPQSYKEEEAPKKPKQYTDTFEMTYYFCPICEYVRITYNQKCCNVCGQKLDWSEEEDE